MTWICRRPCQYINAFCACPAHTSCSCSDCARAITAHPTTAIATPIINRIWKAPGPYSNGLRLPLKIICAREKARNAGVPTGYGLLGKIIRPAIRRQRMIGEKSIVRCLFVALPTLFNGGAGLPPRLVFDRLDLNHIQTIAPTQSLERSAKIRNYIASWFCPEC